MKEYGIIQTQALILRKYPVCYASHATADAVKEIMDVNGLQASDVSPHSPVLVPRVVASNLTYTIPHELLLRRNSVCTSPLRR